MELKQRIFNYRIKHNINQKEMAEIFGIAELTLINLMKGRGTKEITIIKVDNKLKELEEEDNG